MAKNVKISKTSSGTTVLLFGIFLITIYFRQNNADPFNTPKLVLTLILSGLLVGPLIYSYYKLRPKKKSIEFLAVLLSTIFIASLVYSLFNTSVFIRGLIGDTQRRNGLLHYLSIIIIFIFLVRYANFELTKKIIKTCIWLSVILGVYGLAQITGRDFVEWNNPYNAMISTLGNPNFASSMLAFFLSIAMISIYALDFSVIYKVVAFLGSAVAFFAVLKSGSRQGLIVIFVIISIFICFSIATRNRRLGIIAFASNLVLMTLGTLGMLQIGPLQGILYKESISVRGYYWRAGIEMFQNNVFTGVGLDSYLSYFTQYREAGYPENYGFEISSSNAHNTVIQMFATGGIFVGFSYIALLGYVLFCGYKLIKKVDERYKPLSTLLYTSWIGIQSQSLISIDFVGLSIWSWVFSGIIIGLCNQVTSESELLNKEFVENSKSIKLKPNHLATDLFLPRVFSAICLVPIVIVGVLLNRAEEQTFLSSALLNSNQQNSVLANSQKLASNPFADPYYKFKVGLHLMDAGHFDIGVNMIRELSRNDPRQLDYLKVLVKVEMNQNNLNEAVMLRESIAKLDPWNAQNYFELGLLYKSLGNDLKAQEIRDVILKINTSAEYSNRAKMELN